ncbi:MAG: glutamine synthetase beta-grasp domain-containing protein, partial [Planctomycetaceae bacterium]|nr:glutamine synthetase beta-grasp domain-containing protein [Planctomycetaceae bacterium]
MTTPREFFEFAKKHNAEMVDLKFVDMLGTWQHCSYPLDTWDEGTFEEGVGFDGSSIRGWQAINASDMLAIPEASSVRLDPFFKEPTVSVIANIVDPMTKENYSRDPRNVMKKGLAYLKQCNIADTCFVGPEPEFFIFDDVRYRSAQNGTSY